MSRHTVFAEDSKQACVVLPEALKNELRKDADERNVSLSTVIRDYIVIGRAKVKGSINGK